MATFELRSVLTPELLQDMVDTSIPFSKTEPLDYSQVIASLFDGANSKEEKWKSIGPSVWAALKALSHLGLDKVDAFSFQEFLPAPEDDEFVYHALGFILLLDQGPRRLCRGLDARYTDGHFAAYALRLFRYLHQELSPDLRPTSWHRWDKIGVSFDYFIFARDAFNAVVVHNESTAKYCLDFTDETRVLVEQHYDTRDPHRDGVELQQRRWGLYEFPDLIAHTEAGGLPKGPMGVAEGAFWLARLNDVHYPILERFGRYPYRNGALGRASTAEEEAWIHRAKIFPRLPADVQERIREDVDNGRWSPLADKDGEPRV